MKSQLNILHIIVSVLITVLCGLIFIIYGWMSFATFTERPGLYGGMYYYYGTDRMVFALYNFIIALVALLTTIRLFSSLNKEDAIKVKKTFVYFAIFLAMLILTEIYLNTRFVGKG